MPISALSSIITNVSLTEPETAPLACPSPPPKTFPLTFPEMCTTVAFPVNVPRISFPFSVYSNPPRIASFPPPKTESVTVTPLLIVTYAALPSNEICSFSSVFVNGVPTTSPRTCPYLTLAMIDFSDIEERESNVVS